MRTEAHGINHAWKARLQVIIHLLHGTKIWKRCEVRDIGQHKMERCLTIDDSVFFEETTGEK
jgi:hypothetical protein